MRDLVHQNHIGFLLWGGLIGDKIRSLNWNDYKGVDDSVSSNKINFDLKRYLQQLQRRYEQAIARLEAESASQLNRIEENRQLRLRVAREKSQFVKENIAEIERIEFEAEQERLRVLAELERQRQAELERLRLAQIEAERIAEENRRAWEENERRKAAAEQERKAREDAERERRRQEENNNILLFALACIFGGFCRR